MKLTGWAAALGLILAASGGCSDGPGDTDAGTDAGRDAAPMGDIGMDGDACVQGHDCDDGDPDTYGDEYTATCECVGVPCESTTCVTRAWSGRACQVTSINDGDPCDDGDALTVQDRCTNAGVCVGQTVPCAPSDGPCCHSSGVLFDQTVTCLASTLVGYRCGTTAPTCGGDANILDVFGDRHCSGESVACDGPIDEFSASQRACGGGDVCMGVDGDAECVPCI